MLLKVLNPFYKFPKLTLLGVFLGTLFFAFSAWSNLFDLRGHLILDTGFDPLFDNKSPTFSYHQEMVQEFGSEDLLIIALEPVGQYFSLEYIIELEQLRGQIEKTFPSLVSLTSILDIPRSNGDCLGKSYFHSLFLSSSCVNIIKKYQAAIECHTKGKPDRGDEGFELGLNLSESLNEFDEPTNPFSCTQEILKQNLTRIRLDAEKEVHQAISDLKANPLIQKDLFSFDKKTTVLFLRLKHKDTQERDHDLRKLESIIQNSNKEVMKIHYAGQPREQFEITRLLIKDIKSVLPISFLLLSAVALLLFRSFYASLLLFITLSTGMIWTAGIFGIMGMKLNLITLVLPPVITTVGTSYAIHYLAQYFQATKKTGLKHDEILQRSLTRVSLPATLALLTTLTGFSALIWSPIPAIADLGLFSCLGIFLMAAFSLILMPCALSLKPIAISAQESQKAGFLDEWLTWLGYFVNSKPKPIAAFWLLITALAIIGASQVTIESNISNFPAQSKIVKDKAYLEKNFGGSSFIRIIFQTKEKAKDLETAATIDGLILLQDWLLSGDAKTQGIQINRLYSPIDQIDLARQGVDHLNDEEVRFYLSRMDKNYGALFINPQRNLLNVTIRLENHSSKGFIKFSKKLDLKLNEFFPHLDSHLTGNAILSTQSAQNIATSQVTSLAIALCVIFLILSVLFFSLKAGILALIPNIVSIVIFFGLLGLNQIPISATLSVIAAIALGIGIDDSIHFITHFNQNLKELQVETKATSKTLRSVGKPMIFTTIALVVGFGVLMTSEVTGQSSFGWLTATTLLVSLCSSLFLLPAILTQTKFIVLWDYLTLRYTPEFISSIPLFFGMNLVESKLVTLVAKTQDYKKGDKIFTEHESGQDLFVILEGEVEIYFDQKFHGIDKRVARFSRGQVFGEMALFPNAKRMDSARALSKVKLLMLNNQNLSQLKEKIPHTAVKLYLNLVKNLCDVIEGDIQSVTSKNELPFLHDSGTLASGLSNALTKIQSRREDVIRIGNFNVLKNYYHRFVFARSKEEIEEHIHSDKDLVNLLELIIQQGTINYHQIVLIKGYIQLDLSFSKEAEKIIQEFITEIESGKVIEQKPEFSNLLANLTPKELKSFMQFFQIKTLPKDANLYQQNEFGNQMFVVLEGKMLLTRKIDKESQDISILTKGDVAGEIALFTSNHKHSTEVIALENSKYLSINRDNLELFLKTNKKVAAAVIFNLIGVFVTQLRRSILHIYG